MVGGSARHRSHRRESVPAKPPKGYGLNPMPRVLLIRHGESEWNALGRWQGQADPPLSDHGRAQAAAAARQIGAVDLIVASTLDRAAATALIISEHLGIGPVRADSRFIERDAGEWSGLTRAEIKEAWPGYLPEDAADRSQERRPPGWESDEALLERADAALADVAAGLGPDDSAIVVTHGGIIYAYEARLGAPRRYLPNLGARWLQVNPADSSPSDGTGIHTTLGERIHLYDPDADPGQADVNPPDPEAI